MDEPGSVEELRAQSAALDARLEALNRRLTVLEASRPSQGSDRAARRNFERWQKRMTALSQQGDAWGREYLDFLRRNEPRLAEWAKLDPALEDELMAWRQSLSHMEKSLQV